MNNKIMLISILIIALSNLSFRIPVNDGIVTSTFGESRGDHFHDGVDMISADDNVYPVSRGTLLFAWNRSLFPLENYWGGGNYKIINHDTMLSVYMHLQDFDSLNLKVSETDVIGLVGNTGHSYGRHIHFSLLDSIKKESINPFKLLPVVTDTKAPGIMNFYIKIDNRYIRINDNSDIRLTKHYPLLIEIKDVIRGGENLGIYKLKAVFNGKTAADFEFSSINLAANGLSVNGKIFSELFDEKGYSKLDTLVYQEGFNSLTVTVSDFNGNTTEKKFTVNVNLDL